MRLKPAGRIDIGIDLVVSLDHILIVPYSRQIDNQDHCDYDPVIPAQNTDQVGIGDEFVIAEIIADPIESRAHTSQLDRADLQEQHQYRKHPEGI